MGIQNLLIDGFMLVSETPQRVANPWPFVLLSIASIACYLSLNMMLYVLSESRFFKLDISYRILLLFLRNCDLLSLIRQWSLLLINFCGPVPVTNWQIIYVVSGLPVQRNPRCLLDALGWQICSCYYQLIHVRHFTVSHHYRLFSPSPWLPIALSWSQFWSPTFAFTFSVHSYYI